VVTVVCRDKECTYNEGEECKKPICIVIDENNQCLNYVSRDRKDKGWLEHGRND
jgi:hypothetical protein